MKSISNHLGEIIVALACVALLISAIALFGAPIGDFFESIVAKETAMGEQVMSDIADIDVSNIGVDGSGGGAGGNDGEGGSGGSEGATMISFTVPNPMAEPYIFEYTVAEGTTWADFVGSAAAGGRYVIVDGYVKTTNDTVPPDLFVAKYVDDEYVKISASEPIISGFSYTYC